ncbi:MAG: hypothetical protein EA417_06975 [Gammaproteobacteria bacterium]|nr:MAG: hypothetical protein EA417_06975 [Gammaproteobacteria bacterium]
MLKDIALNTLPGLEDLPDEVTIPGYAEDHPWIPNQDQNYVFRKDDVRVVLGHLSTPSPEGLLLTGPRGCGKSSVVYQLHAWLRRPLVAVSGYKQAEFEDLLGTKEIVDGDTLTMDGPLVQALGTPYCTFLFDEIDRAAPGVSVALNSLLDGYDLVHVLDSGRRIPPAEGFRFMSTANTNGMGDLSGDYNTAHVLDTAFIDRNWVHSVWYPTPDEEFRILRGAVDPDIADDPIHRSIRLANDVRYLYTGRDNEASASGQALGVSGSIETTMSTRSLVMLWRVMMLFPNVDQPIIHALKLAVTNKCTPEGAEAIHRLAEAHFGDG